MNRKYKCQKLVFMLVSGIFFCLAEENYEEFKRDYLALVITVVDIVDGTAYLFDKEKINKQRN